MKIKKLYNILFLFALVVVASSCTKDKCTRTTTFIQMDPIYMDYEEFRASVASTEARPLENPGKIYYYQNYLFINELRKGVHIYDLSDSTNPQRVSFINILGNIDIAVKGNILYADSFMDVLAIDISDPLNVSVVNRVEAVFPQNMNRGIVYDDQNGVVVDWNETEVTEEVECSSNRRDGGIWFNTQDDVFFDSAESVGVPTASNGGGSSNESGVGGSFARFTINGNYLYAIDNSSMYPFDISNTQNPVASSDPVYIGWNIETVFPYKNHIFIGSESGMFIYSLANPNQPSYVSEFAHVRGCDPVVVEGDLAYVTLRNGNPTCGGFANQLDIINISNLNQPNLIVTHDMTNPHGLDIDNGTLFICDGEDGLKIYDATNSNDLDRIAHYDDIEVTDVFTVGNKLFAIGSEGFRLYDYSNLDDIKLLSTIPVGN